MDDSLTDVGHLKLDNAKLPAVAVQRLDLLARHRIVDPMAAVSRWNVVIGHGQHRIDAPGLAVRQPQALEGLRRGHFVDQMTVDVQQRRAIRVGAHDMCIPDLVVQGLAGHDQA